MLQRYVTGFVWIAALAVAVPAAAQTVADQTQKPRPPAGARPVGPARDPIGFRRAVNEASEAVRARMQRAM